MERLINKKQMNTLLQNKIIIEAINSSLHFLELIKQLHQLVHVLYKEIINVEFSAVEENKLAFSQFVEAVPTD
jgi:hypothetical protein